MLPVLLALLAAAALALPETDPAEKPVDLTRGDSVGTWVSDGAGLGLEKADPKARYNWWLSEQKVGSGVVRARLSVGDKLDSTVLFRASGEGATLSGYGFSFEGDSVGFYRWTDGAAVPMGKMEKVPGLSTRDAVEVVLYLVGPHVAAVVLDATSLEELASVTLHDTSFVRGRVGYRAHDGQGPNTRLVLLSVLTTELGAAPITPANDAWGQERLATVDASATSKLPEGAEVLATQNGRARIVASPEVLEKARRLGIGVKEVTGYVGRWAKDEEFRENAAKPYTEGPDGLQVTSAYKDYRMVEQILQALHRRYPDVTDLRPIGTTHGGRTMWALRVTDAPKADEDEPAVLLGASMHGSELLAVDYGLDALTWTLNHQDDPRVARWIRELDLWFVPLINVDGNFAYWHVSTESGRKNMRDNDGDGQFEHWEGVDLNRNFPFGWASLGEKGSKSAPQSGWYRGPSPGSEPETKAIMKLADERRFVAAISWHTVSTVVITPYSIDGQPNPAVDVPRVVAESIAETMPVQPNKKRYDVVRKIYSVDGVDQDWHYHQHGTLAYIVEGSHHNPKDPAIRAKSVAGVRPFFQGLLDRVVEGPRVYGHTVDESGAPVEAVVVVDEIGCRNGETWRSRPRDGRFDRVVLEPGSYTVRASAPGYGEAVRTVEVGDGATGVELVLTRGVAGD